jgi:predicted amidohydrolase
MKFISKPFLPVCDLTKGNLIGIFDENGILEIADDSVYIARMKANFAVQEQIKVEPPIELSKGDGKETEVPIEIPTELKKCKKCTFTCTSQGDLLAHYRKTHPKKKE